MMRPADNFRSLLGLVLFFGTTIIGLVVDLWTKSLAAANLDPHRPYTIVRDWLQLTYTENRGAVFGLVAEAGSGRSFYKFVRALVEANRADGIVSRAEWLAALDAATRKPDLSRDIARLLDRGVPEPEEFVADLLGRAGVDFTLDTAGLPKLR